MKLPRNVKISRGHLDAAPFAGVLFCLLIFVLLGSLIYTPGVLIQLPAAAADQPGVEGPVLAVALDANGQYYFNNQVIPETDLLQKLKTEVGTHTEPLTLMVSADTSVTLGQLNHLRDIAAKVGIKHIWQAVLPRVFDAPADAKAP